MKEQVIYRTYVLALKILHREDPIRLLEKFAQRENNDWIVKKPNKYRIKNGARMFSERVARLWSVLTEEEKIGTLKISLI